ncbi:uncharacterized protein DS421_11g328730 [Arachis hypogaea]|nr:uncharacterized protein DS421_11g328730 [Arachis hypogaea]
MEALTAAVAHHRMPSLLFEQSSSPPFCCSGPPPPLLEVRVAVGEGSCASVFLAAGSSSVTFRTTAEASGYFCRRWRLLPSPSLESDHRCRLGWLSGLPPSRFGDRRCFGSAILPRSWVVYPCLRVVLGVRGCFVSLVQVAVVTAKVREAVIQAADNFGLREKVLVTCLGYDFVFLGRGTF